MIVRLILELAALAAVLAAPSEPSPAAARSSAAVVIRLE